MKISAGIIIRFLIILFAAITVIASFHYSHISGGSDLRNRVVAARLLGKGYSPYFHKWNPADGERLADPNDFPARLVNGNTATPAVLYVFYPLTFLPYPDIRFIWTVFQILAAIVVVRIMLKRYEGSSPLQAAAIVLFGLLFSDYWLMHIERGQVQILFLLFFAIAFYFYTGKLKSAEFFSGFTGGLFIFFRPFALLFCLGFFLHGKRSWIKGWATGVITGLLIFLAPNTSVWKDYYKAMEEYSNACMNSAHEIRNAIHYPLPTVIEGAGNLTMNQNFDITCMPAMYGIIQKLGIPYSPVLSYVSCGIILLIFSLFFYRNRSRSAPVHLFLFGFLTYKILELGMLGWRSPYSLILWIFPLFLIVQQIQKRSVQMLILLMSLLFLHNFPFYFHYQTFIGESVLLFFVGYFAFTTSRIKTPEPVWTES